MPISLSHTLTHSHLQTKIELNSMHRKCALSVLLAHQTPGDLSVFYFRFFFSSAFCLVSFRFGRGPTESRSIQNAQNGTT